MFVIKYSYFDCYCKLNICTLYVYSCVPLLCVFFNHRFIYFACLTFTGIKLCVFQPSIYLLCVFDFHWNQIVCFPISSSITLCVYHWKWLLCMSEKNCPCHFECLRLLMFTLCVWIMFECLRLPIQSLIIHNTVQYIYIYILHVYTRITRVYIFFALFNSFHAIHTSVHVEVSVCISSIPCFLFFIFYFLFIYQKCTDFHGTLKWVLDCIDPDHQLFYTHILIFSEVVLFLRKSKHTMYICLTCNNNQSNCTWLQTFNVVKLLSTKHPM
jgi:hypothetical protein